jgi:hypothetical protein
MIALCREHHDKADAGGYTDEELRAMKSVGRDRNLPLAASFAWRRHRLLAVVGGNFYYETRVPVLIGEIPVVALNRDDDERLLLNIAMPSTVSHPRLRVDDNFWLEAGAATAIESPPHGRLLGATYANGDRIRIEFFEVLNGNALMSRYPNAMTARDFLEHHDPDGFPITSVELQMRVVSPEGQPIIDFDANEMRVGGFTMSGCFLAHSHGGLHLG